VDIGRWEKIGRLGGGLATQNRNFVRNVIRHFYNYLFVFFENCKIKNKKKIFTIALTIPISSAACKRSFSAMKKIKTWLRTSLVQYRLSDFSLLYIEKYKKR
jgi:hypothetical protein